MTRALLLVAIAAALSGCHECLGTSSCRVRPHISLNGQFIEHRSGRVVGGTVLEFVRDSGVALVTDTVRAVSDGDGFFELFADAEATGKVRGRLRVTPPAPFTPYTIDTLRLTTTRVRGDGTNAGRFVVDPYVLLIGHVRDRRSLAPLAHVTVTMRRVGGGRLDQDSMRFTADFGGQFSWEPAILDRQPIDVSFEIDVGHHRTYMVRRTIPISYRDGENAFIVLPVGWGLAYGGVTERRGNGERLPDVRVEFERLAGINTSPQRVTVAVDPRGGFVLPVNAESEGGLTARLRLLPPAPIPSESYVVEMSTSDDDTPISLGTFRYGAQAYWRAALRWSDDRTPLPTGTTVRIQRAAGVQVLWPSPSPDATRAVTEGGQVTFQAATADSGAVDFDLTVELPAPFAWDTLRRRSTARYSDTQENFGDLSVRRRFRP